MDRQRNQITTEWSFPRLNLPPPTAKRKDGFRWVLIALGLGVFVVILGCGLMVVGTCSCYILFGVIGNGIYWGCHAVVVFIVCYGEFCDDVGFVGVMGLCGCSFATVADERVVGLWGVDYCECGVWVYDVDYYNFEAGGYC